MKVVLNIPDEIFPAVCESYGFLFGYEPKLVVDGKEVDNPTTIEQFTTETIAGDVLRNHERGQTRIAMDRAAVERRQSVREEMGLATKKKE